MGQNFLCSLWRLLIAAIIAIYKNIYNLTIYKLQPSERARPSVPMAQAHEEYHNEF